MFKSARLKLTIWYLIIIVLITTFFSGVIYKVLVNEFDRIQMNQRVRGEIQMMVPNPTIPRPPIFDPEVINDAKRRLVVSLLIIDSIIIASSAIGGYFLAGRTLRPIKEMVDDQSRFIADASHELRTPLTSLKTEIEVGLRDKDIKLAEAKRILTSNLEEVNRLQYLSDNLIKVTQYNKSAKKVNILKFTMSSALDNALKVVGSLSKHKQIKIILGGKDFKVTDNKDTITELLVIFLDNAIKYSPKKTSIKLFTSKKDGTYEISISDKGYGISEKDIPHIFDRFYRSDKSRTNNGTFGYGLGLSIAKEIVDQRNGNISVVSKASKGTTFTIKLPVIYS